MSEYQSSMMRCTGCEDDGCEICRFIVHGETTTKLLLHVIEHLDVALAAREGMCKLLTKALVSSSEWTDELIRLCSRTDGHPNTYRYDIHEHLAKRGEQ